MISIIIPTRNRADMLDKALISIVNQNIPMSKFEVLVVDNGSTDGTKNVINEYNCKFSNFKGIYAPEPGLHNGRHAGMKAAQGEILVFADDDIEAFPTWLSSIETGFKDSKVAMVGGNNYPLFMQSPPEWLNRMWQRPTIRGYRAIPSLSVIEFTRQQKEIPPYLVWGCNFSIRKAVLLEAGGFHPDGMPMELIRFRGDGETHVSRYVDQTGLKCVLHPGASVHHKITVERMSHAYFRQRGFNQGVSDSYTELRRQDLQTKTSRRSSLSRALGYPLTLLLSLFDGAEIKRAVTELQRGHRAGFAYHQACYREDSEVREWVHRPTYF